MPISIPLKLVHVTGIPLNCFAIVLLCQTSFLVRFRLPGSSTIIHKSFVLFPCEWISSSMQLYRNTSGKQRGTTAPTVGRAPETTQVCQTHSPGWNEEHQHSKMPARSILNTTMQEPLSSLALSSICIAQNTRNVLFIKAVQVR